MLNKSARTKIYLGTYEEISSATSVTYRYTTLLEAVQEAIKYQFTTVPVATTVARVASC